MSIDQQYKEYIEKHFLESKKSAFQMENAIIESELNAGNQNYTHTLHIPKIFSQEDKQRFHQIVHKTYTIFEKVIQAYKEDEKIRSLFPFSKQLEDFILLPNRYDVSIPICRIDIFYDEKTKDFKFCEFNTDGTSAMHENAKLAELLKFNNVYRQDPHTYEQMELEDHWVDAFLSLADDQIPPHPMVAIVDFLENAYLNELYVFQQIFKRHGCQCEVLDIRDLAFDGTHLHSIYTNRKIDMVYRRVVTSDIVDRCAGLDFLEAIKQQAVILIGGFQTQIIHNKQINQVLRHPWMQAYLTDEENAFMEKHLPKTYDLNKNVPIDLDDKDHWIIKPKDSYGAQGVWAGVDLHQAQWDEQVKRCMDRNYLVQEYIQPYRNQNIDLVREKEFKPYANMTGLYVYNGQFAGVYSRCSDGGVISTQYNERSIPTLFMV